LSIFGDEDFKRVSVMCGGNNGPTVLNSKVSGLDDIINSTSSQLFGYEGVSRSSSISKDCTQSQQKWWAAEVKIVTVTIWKERIQYLPAKIRNHTIAVLGRKSKHVLQNCIKQSPTRLIQILPPTKLTNVQRNVCEDGVARIT
jgi:hypothetical protein